MLIVLIQRLESREIKSAPLSGFYAKMFIVSIDKLNHEMQPQCVFFYAMTSC